ncbi:MAG: hypothetical protein C0599_02250 [Salinivirgaceae bacterium]|nr:MAG: hypothetical protein C0599_02250 [Salinivirgaceae bacterium]
MNNKNSHIIIFSIDLVFVNIQKRILEEINTNLKITVLELFSEAQHLSEEDEIQLILVDDVINGTSSYELISYLRLNKKLTCPIFHFDTTEYQNERRSLLIGASKFFNKPFNPEAITKQIRNTMQQ